MTTNIFLVPLSQPTWVKRPPLDSRADFVRDRARSSRFDHARDLWHLLRPCRGLPLDLLVKLDSFERSRTSTIVSRTPSSGAVGAEGISTTAMLRRQGVAASRRAEREGLSHRVVFHNSPAEDMSVLPDCSVDKVIAVECAFYFDRRRFYR